MSKLQLTDPAVLKKRILCQNITSDELFEAMVLEVAPSGKYVRLMRSNGCSGWGTFALVRVVEVLGDDPTFGQLSPCS